MHRHYISNSQQNQKINEGTQDDGQGHNHDMNNKENIQDKEQTLNKNTSSSSASLINKIPQDTLGLALSYLDLHTLSRMMVCCRSIYRTADTDNLWTPLARRCLQGRLILNVAIRDYFIQKRVINIQGTDIVDNEDSMDEKLSRSCSCTSLSSDIDHSDNLLLCSTTATTQQRQPSLEVNNAYHSCHCAINTTDVNEQPTNMRRALMAACRDARRCVLTPEEIAQLTFNVRVRQFKELEPVLDVPMLPRNHEPINVMFNANTMTYSFAPNQFFRGSGRWEYVEHAHPGIGIDFDADTGSVIIIEDNNSVDTDDNKTENSNAKEIQQQRQRTSSHTNRIEQSHQPNTSEKEKQRKSFSSLRCGAEAPLRLWRHPVNWHVCMTSTHMQYASYSMPPVGSDFHLDDDQAYIHPVMKEVLV